VHASGRWASRSRPSGLECAAARDIARFDVPSDHTADAAIEALRYDDPGLFADGRVSICDMSSVDTPTTPI
jgi:hypothetical protein